MNAATKRANDDAFARDLLAVCLLLSARAVRCVDCGSLVRTDAPCPLCVQRRRLALVS